MKLRTKNLSLAIIREAMGIAGGLYSMNARDADGYGFHGSTVITRGEFLYTIDNRDTFDGIIDFKTKTLLDVKANEFYPLTRFIKRTFFNP